LKAGVLEDGAVHPNDEGTPQGGSISVLLSNLYLHYVLDLWFERVVKCRLRGEAHLVRYIDDFVICFQYRSDALRVQDALRRRLGKFGLALEPTKTKLVEFGRFAQRHAGKRGRNRPETIYFLGLTLYCTRNRKGNFRVGMRADDLHPPLAAGCCAIDLRLRSYSRSLLSEFHQTQLRKPEMDAA
jgi:RNA-directed DNA polymerase